MFNTATRLILIASETAIITTQLITRGTIGRSMLLNGTCDTALLHMLVGRNFGINVMSLENQRKRHSDHKKSDKKYRQQYDY